VESLAILSGHAVRIDAIVEAMQKVLKNIESLRDLDHKAIRHQRLSRADRES
jgi:predicted Ser/Thr protein kinase